MVNDMGLARKIYEYEHAAKAAGMTDAYDTEREYQYAARVMRGLVDAPSEISSLIVRERELWGLTGDYRHWVAFHALESLRGGK